MTGTMLANTLTRAVRTVAQIARRSAPTATIHHTQRCLHTDRLLRSAGIVQHRVSPDNLPDTPWEFTKENMEKVKVILAKFPENYKASAVMPLLTLAQEQNDNWLPLAAMNYVAKLLDMPAMRVYEVATFYTMYNREPMAKYHLQVCGTTPCMLCGSEKILSALEKKLGVPTGQASADNAFVVTEVECLGACANAPMLQLNNHEYYENLDEENIVKLVDQLRSGSIAATKVGPQSGLQRVAEGPQGKTTLHEQVDEFKSFRNIDDLPRLAKEAAEKAKREAEEKAKAAAAAKA